MISLLCLLLIAPASAAPPEPTSPAIEALKAEITIAKDRPDEYYLVIDLPAGTVTLKTGGKPLLSTAVVRHAADGWTDVTELLTYRETCPPHTPVAARKGQRLAGRRLPLDFVGRLIEGPTRYDRLVFTPFLVITSDRVPLSAGASPYVVVSGPDLKSLSSAMEAGTRAILIPPARHP